MYILQILQICVPGLISHHFRQVARLRSERISPYVIRVPILPTLSYRMMPLSHRPSGRQLILQLSKIYRNRLDLSVPPIWRHCCVKLFPTRTQLLSGWISLTGAMQSCIRQNEAGSVAISHLLLSIVSLRTLWVSLTVIQLTPLIMLDDS